MIIIQPRSWLTNIITCNSEYLCLLHLLVCVNGNLWKFEQLIGKELHTSGNARNAYCMQKAVGGRPGRGGYIIELTGQVRARWWKTEIIVKTLRWVNQRTRDSVSFRGGGDGDMSVGLFCPQSQRRTPSRLCILVLARVITNNTLADWLTAKPAHQSRELAPSDNILRPGVLAGITLFANVHK